ncbi:MAG: hypothetical protein K9L82_18740, partial [Chromatiaceae bacterium]|nr:hypothetical protein [Chromatiaceae bacterium]
MKTEKAIAERDRACLCEKDTECGLNILCSTAARRPKLIDLLPELRPASDGLCERAQAEHDAGTLGL